MPTETKACNLTEDEIEYLISVHGNHLDQKDLANRIERINYLHKRLKAFQEEQPRAETKPEAGTAPATTSVQTTPTKWGT